MNRLESLMVANQVRTARAGFRREAQRPQVIDAVLNPPEWLRRVEVRWLLCACPGIGPAKAERILRRARITGSRELGRLSVRERYAIVEELR